MKSDRDRIRELRLAGIPIPDEEPCFDCGCDPCRCDDPPEPETEEDVYFAVDCHLDRNGYCGKVGSEECDFCCPFNHLIGQRLRR
jgi:hypothetical protein